MINAKKGLEIYNRFNRALVMFDYAIVVFLTIIISFDVVMRKITGISIVWVTEISEYSLLWITFLGSAWLLSEGGHVNVDIIVTRLNKTARKTVDFIMSIIGAAINLIITIYGIQLCISFCSRGVPSVEMLGIPRWIVLLVIPLGCALLTIQFVIQAINVLNERED